LVAPLPDPGRQVLLSHQPQLFGNDVQEIHDRHSVLFGWHGLGGGGGGGGTEQFNGKNPTEQFSESAIKHSPPPKDGHHRHRVDGSATQSEQLDHI